MPELIELILLIGGLIISGLACTHTIYMIYTLDKLPVTNPKSELLLLYGFFGFFPFLPFGFCLVMLIDIFF